MATRTMMVNSNGNRFSLFSVQRALNSSEWFFFMIIARRKGESADTVSKPVIRLATHSTDIMRFIIGWMSVNMTVVMAMERMV